MFTIDAMKQVLAAEISQRYCQGYDILKAKERLEKATNSYDELFAIAHELRHANIRSDWTYVEPDDLDDILAECDPNRALGQIRELPTARMEKRIGNAFLTSICGCILGKPLEEPPFGTLQDIRTAAQEVGQWPIRDYISDEMLSVWGRRNPSWTHTTKGNVHYVAPDDDITYTLMGMMLLESKGIHFTHDDIRQLWIENMPIYQCWGPERTILLKAGIASLTPNLPVDMTDWVDMMNPGQELCGALIRVDAYGYACPGNPQMAAKLAWKDASFTHRKTGVYSAMFIAAAIATAFIAKSWREIVETALQYIPTRSRFYEQACECLRLVEAAKDFTEGYNAVHNRFASFTAGQIVQEIGTVINTLKFAQSAEDGIALQAAQGNDTDSFACSCGSILGAYFKEGLPDHWVSQFGDVLTTTMTCFNERSLSAVVNRMAVLYRKI